MAQITHNVGTNANDGTGDALRTAFQNQNTMNGELYNHIRIDTIAPTVNDDINSTTAVNVGCLWIETTSSPNVLYVCLDNTDGAAVWHRVTHSVDGTIDGGSSTG